METYQDEETLKTEYWVLRGTSVTTSILTFPNRKRNSGRKESQKLASGNAEEQVPQKRSQRFVMEELSVRLRKGSVSFSGFMELHIEDHGGV